MFAITGITGRVGGVVAEALLRGGHQVRAVLRSREAGARWRARGCEVAVTDMDDGEGMRQAFSGVVGVFVVLPPNFDPSPGFPESRRLISNLRRALERSAPAKVVCLSTIGAQARQVNLLTQLGLLEQELGSISLPVTFLRAAWFIENTAGDVDSARSIGVVRSFLQPLDRRIPMVATADVGEVAAELLSEQWYGRRIVEVEGPCRICPDDIAACFARLLGHPVRAAAVPRESWETLFRSQGMKNPTPRIQMLDGFNQGWLAFEHTARKGHVELDSVLRALLG